VRSKSDTWALQDAKARLSEVVERAATTGAPQRITRRGKDAVVVVSAPLYAKHTRPRDDTVRAFMKRSPLAELQDSEWDVVLARPAEDERPIDID